PRLDVVGERDLLGQPEVAGETIPHLLVLRVGDPVPVDGLDRRVQMILHRSLTVVEGASKGSSGRRSGATDRSLPVWASGRAGGGPAGRRRGGNAHPGRPFHDGHRDVRRMCSRRSSARFWATPLRRDRPARRRLSERPAVNSSAALPSGTAAAPPSRPPAARSLAPDIARGLMLVLIAVANVSWVLWGHEGAVGMTPHVPARGPVDTAVQLMMTVAVDRRAVPLVASLFGYALVPFHRSRAPDIARGLLLVLVAVAIVSWFLWGHEGAVGMTPDVPARGPVDTAVQLMMTVAVDHRAMPLFAFLFGYGMVQFHRSRIDRGMAPGIVRVMLRRRHWAMLLLGFAHAVLLFYGDILGAYAIAGL